MMQIAIKWDNQAVESVIKLQEKQISILELCMPMNVGESHCGPGFAGAIWLPNSMPSRNDSILSICTHFQAGGWKRKRT